MDFIDWCHYILGIFEREKYNQYLRDYEIPQLIFPKNIVQQPTFHGSIIWMGMYDTIKILQNAELLEEINYSWRISVFGRKVLKDPTEFWSEICQQEFEPDEEKLLKIVNSSSPQLSNEPFYGWLKEVTQDDFLPLFGINSLERKSNEQMQLLQRYIYDLPELLSQHNFLQADARNGYHTNLKPTYESLVWELKKGVTIESKLIAELVKEWETTNVDFKREINLSTKKQKAEFAKDVLGLATTKSSGRRYIIIGFDDKTREYFAPPATHITQEIMEQHLANLTDPVVNIRYEIVDYQKGKVGKLEVFREPEKLPYKAKKDVIIDEKGKKGLEKDKVYVRHGSHTESPSEIELKMLEEEGQRARGEI